MDSPRGDEYGFVRVHYGECRVWSHVIASWPTYWSRDDHYEGIGVNMNTPIRYEHLSTNAASNIINVAERPPPLGYGGGGSMDPSNCPTLRPMTRSLYTKWHNIHWREVWAISVILNITHKGYWHSWDRGPGSFICVRSLWHRKTEG